MHVQVVMLLIVCFLLSGLARHLPVGLLFDLLAHKSMLPWNIIVHFSVSEQAMCLSARTTLT